MQFNFLLLTSVLALTANAADSKESKSTTIAAAATTTSAGLTPEQSAITACLDACKAGDVDCQAKCIAVPSPNTQQVNSTNNCVAACPIGKGTASENRDYEKCVNDCIGKYYYTTTGTPAQTTKAKIGSDSAAPTATQADVVSTVTSGDSIFTTTMHPTQGAAASNTDKGSAEATHTNAAQAMNKLAPIGSGIGFLGFLAAIFAL
ncbi:hypothetical protein PG995_002167 [Apiospora arundinis]